MFETIYEQCLAYEFERDALTFGRQVRFNVEYAGATLPLAFIADFIVEQSVVVELKSIERMLPVHSAQMLTYLRLSGLKKGLLINFNTKLLRDGIKSFVL